MTFRVQRAGTSQESLSSRACHRILTALDGAFYPFTFTFCSISGVDTVWTSNTTEMICTKFLAICTAHKSCSLWVSVRTLCCLFLQLKEKKAQIKSCFSLIEQCPVRYLLALYWNGSELALGTCKSLNMTFSSNQNQSPQSHSPALSILKPNQMCHSIESHCSFLKISALQQRVIQPLPSTVPLHDRQWRKGVIGEELWPCTHGPQDVEICISAIL